MICPHCGRESDPLFKFCLHCGKELVGTLREAAPPAEKPALKLVEKAPPKAVEKPPAAPPPAEAAVQPITAEAKPHVGTTTLRCPRCRGKLKEGVTACPLCGHKLPGGGTPERKQGETTPFRGRATTKGQPAGFLISVSSLDGRETVKMPIYAGRNSLGRGTGCDIQFREDDLLSPTHLVLEVRDGKVQLLASGSRNGTFVRLSDQVKVEHGDQFRIGQQLLVFEQLDKLENVVQAKEQTTGVLGSLAGPKAWGRLTQVVTERHPGASFLLIGENVFLGRERGNITFPADRYVSSTHAVIAKAGDGVFLKDVGSSNGTYVRVKGDMDLSSGQYFLAGRQLFKLYIGA